MEMLALTCPDTGVPEYQFIYFKENVFFLKDKSTERSVWGCSVSSCDAVVHTLDVSTGVLEESVTHNHDNTGLDLHEICRRTSRRAQEDAAAANNNNNNKVPSSSRLKVTGSQQENSSSQSRFPGIWQWMKDAQAVTGKSPQVVQSTLHNACICILLTLVHAKILTLMVVVAPAAVLVHSR